MARILNDGEWYESISSDALYEDEIRKIFIKRSDEILPGYHVSRFDVLVESSFGSGKPDLALVAKNYADWWVVELELAHHSLDGHVVPQIRKFANGSYGDDHACYISKKTRGLDRRKVEDLVRGLPPKILVLVNSPCPEWEAPLKVLNASVAVFEIYRSRMNRTIFRLDGEVPTSPSVFFSICEVAPLMPRFVIVRNPLVLQKRAGPVRVFFRGRATYWTIVTTRDSTYLSPAQVNPLRTRTRYSLERKKDGSLEIRPG